MTIPANATSAADRLEFYTAAEYRAELTRLLRGVSAGDRVLVTSMTLEPTEPAIRDLVHEVQAAAERGADVTLAVDAHTFMVGRNGLGPLWSRRTMPKKLRPYYQHKLDILQAVNSAPSGQAAIINKPERRYSVPVAGRSHIKVAIVNDRIFLGGCNLQGSNWVDMMVGWEDRRSADWLYSTMQSVIQGGHAAKALGGVDRSLQVNADTQILLDSGSRRQSLILDEALALIDEAGEWLLITCQYFPNSITARHLLKAQQRGVEVEIIFSHPSHQGLVGGLGQHYSLLREKARLPKTLFKHALGKTDPMLHAKLIASDAGVMIGSHNYVRAGVILGTAEIALLSKDKRLAREAVSTLRRALSARPAKD